MGAKKSWRLYSLNCFEMNASRKNSNGNGEEPTIGLFLNLNHGKDSSLDRASFNNWVSCYSLYRRDMHCGSSKDKMTSTRVCTLRGGFTRSHHMKNHR